MGSVLDTLRSGHPSTEKETFAEVSTPVMCLLYKSTRKRSAELGIKRSTKQLHIKMHFSLKSFRTVGFSELTDDDMLDRYNDKVPMDI